MVASRPHRHSGPRSPAAEDQGHLTAPTSSAAAVDGALSGPTSAISSSDENSVRTQATVTSSALGRAPRERSRARVAPYPVPDRSLSRYSFLRIEEQQPSTPVPNQYQLVVRPIIKSTIAQRDSSGDTLESVTFSGGSFNEIMLKLWNQFSFRVKCHAVKTDGLWSMQSPDAGQWEKVMQFKVKKHLVDTTKSEQAWKHWLMTARGETVTLLVYEYGVGIIKAQDLDDFKEACIRPEQTTDSRLEGNLPVPNLTRSANVALDCVRSSMADPKQLRRDWEAIGRRLEAHERNLEIRKRIIEAFIQDIAPPSGSRSNAQT